MKNVLFATTATGALLIGGIASAQGIALFGDARLGLGYNITTGTGTKTGRRMGHMPIDGADGSLAALGHLPGRRIYIHINNTNPILVAGSPERTRVERAGWEIAADGMEIVL